MTYTPFVQAGDLRHRAAIHDPPLPGDEERDAYGGVIRSGQVITERWTRIVPLQGSERVEANGVAAGVTHKVLLRPVTPKPSPRAWLVYDGRRFEIRSWLDVDERGTMIELLVEEQV